MKAAYNIFIFAAIAVGVYLILKILSQKPQEYQYQGGGQGGGGKKPVKPRNWKDASSYRPNFSPMQDTNSLTRDQILKRNLDPQSPYYQGAGYVEANYAGGYEKWVKDNWGRLESIGTTGKDELYQQGGLRVQFYGETHLCGWYGIFPNYCNWWYYEVPQGAGVKRTPDGFIFSRHNAVHRGEVRTSSGNTTLFDQGKDLLIKRISQNAWEVIL